MQVSLCPIIPVDKNGHVVSQVCAGRDGNLKPALDGHRSAASFPTQRTRRSLAFKYAVPGNVAARAGNIGKTNAPATARANRQRHAVLKNGLKLRLALFMWAIFPKPFV